VSVLIEGESVIHLVLSVIDMLDISVCVCVCVLVDSQRLFIVIVCESVL